MVEIMRWVPHRMVVSQTGELGAIASVAIGLGSNLGNSAQILRQALVQITRLEATTLGRVSALYRTKPVGPPQPDYVNACALLLTRLPAAELLRQVQGIEQCFGRVRTERWGPRTLDLDILLWGDRQIDQPDLQVPHPRLAERSFVLVPLAEIAPNWHHPVLRTAIAQLLQTVDCSDVQPL